MWFVHVNLPIGRLTSVRNVDPHRGNGTVTLLTLTLSTKNYCVRNVINTIINFLFSSFSP
jgi:hypothetical protein